MPPARIDLVFSFAALWDAAARAARGKRFGASVARYRLDLEGRLLALRDALLHDRWRPGAPIRLAIHDPKLRIITIPPFEDRVVHHALCAVMGPRIERRMIRHSFACRVGQGTHAAMRLARAWARTHRWVAHLDVARYFPTIDHEVVGAQIARDNPEDFVRSLAGRIIAAGGAIGEGHRLAEEDLFAVLDRRAGLPLGSLTSQLWANRYLDPVDHHLKDRLGHRAYLRYMDDFLLFHDDRAALEHAAREVERACHALRLRLHPWAVHPTKAGVGFVGYRVRSDHLRVRRSTVARAERRLRWALQHVDGPGDPAFRARLRSTFAHWSHADAWRLQERTLRRLGILYVPGEPR